MVLHQCQTPVTNFYSRHQGFKSWFSTTLVLERINSMSLLWSILCVSVPRFNRRRRRRRKRRWRRKRRRREGTETDKVMHIEEGDGNNSYMWRKWWLLCVDLDAEAKSMEVEERVGGRANSCWNLCLQVSIASIYIDVVISCQQPLTTIFNYKYLKKMNFMYFKLGPNNIPRSICHVLCNQ